MDSQTNFDDDGVSQLNEIANDMQFDTTGPLSMNDFDFSFLDEAQAYPVAPLLNTNLAGNYQGNAANPTTDFESLFVPVQNNFHMGSSHASQGVGNLPNQSFGSYDSQSTQLPHAQPWGSQTSSNWSSVAAHGLPAQPYMPQNVQGRTRHHAALPIQQPMLQYRQQFYQSPMPQYGQQQTQQCLPQSRQQPERLPRTTEQLRPLLKEPGTDVFKARIYSFEEAMQLKKVYLSLGDVNKQPQEAVLQGRQMELVERLYHAIRRSGQIGEVADKDVENPAIWLPNASSGQSQNKRKREGTKGQSDAAVLRLPPITLELLCWEFLEAIIKAQAGQNRIPEWYTAKPSGYGRFETLDRRFEACEQVLKDSKIMCKSLLEGDEWQARIAWNPIREAQRKSSNKQINKERSQILRAGNALIRGQRSNNEPNDMNDVELKLDDSEQPSKAIKLCPGTESPSVIFDLPSRPTESTLPATGHYSSAVNPYWPGSDNHSTVKADTASSTHDTMPFEDAILQVNDTRSSHPEIQDPEIQFYTSNPQTQTPSLDDFEMSSQVANLLSTDPFPAGGGDTEKNDFLDQESLADFDWDAFYNPQPAQHSEDAK